MQNYTVKRGDTLYGISNQFGVSVEDIKYQLKILNLLIIYLLTIYQLVKF